MKVAFLGTPDFIEPVRETLQKNFQLVESIEEADLLVVASYGQILPKETIDKPKFGSLNIHPSLLPKYRGPSPIQRAILEGAKETGVSIMKMDEEVDHGPIISQETLSISEDETFQSLAEKSFKLGAEMLIKVIPDYVEGKIPAKAQDHSQATFTPRLERKDGYFDINQPPDLQKLDRMVRAYYPWPGVWTKWKGKIVKFYPKGLVQMEGKKVVTLEEFLNGYRDFPITILS